MNAWLPRLLAHTPAGVRRYALLQLFAATSAAFRCDMPQLRGLRRDECLLIYARFTAERAAAALREERGLAALQARLYGNAYHLGRTPGRLLRVRDVPDVMALARFFYCILDIDFQGSEGGEIAIGRCYFSNFYSPEICRLMSAMDRGLLAGLADGGELAFSERITEGRACCRARFTMEHKEQTR